MVGATLSSNPKAVIFLSLPFITVLHRNIFLSSETKIRVTCYSSSRQLCEIAHDKKIIKNNK